MTFCAQAASSAAGTAALGETPERRVGDRAQLDDGSSTPRGPIGNLFIGSAIEHVEGGRLYLLGWDTLAGHPSIGVSGNDTTGNVVTTTSGSEIWSFCLFTLPILAGTDCIRLEQHL